MIESVLERIRDKAGSSDGEGTSERELLVITDGTETVESVRTSGQVPIEGDEDPKNSGRKARSVDVEEYENSKKYFTVRIRYSTIQFTISPAGNPILKPPIRRWSFQGGSRPIFAAEFLGNIDQSQLPTAALVGDGIAGYPIVNSAMEPFDSIPDDFSGGGPTYSFQRNELVLDPGFVNYYFKAVNADPFLGTRPGQCLINNISAVQITENGVTCWSIQYEFLFRELGFLLTLKDEGLNEAPDLEDTNKSASQRLMRKPIIGSNGVAVSDPQPLNGHGVLLTPDADFVYRRWKLFPERSFSLLNIS